LNACRLVRLHRLLDNGLLLGGPNTGAKGGASPDESPEFHMD
jgi:hypothetical protein